MREHALEMEKLKAEVDKHKVDAEVSARSITSTQLTPPPLAVTLDQIGSLFRVFRGDQNLRND